VRFANRLAIFFVGFSSSRKLNQRDMQKVTFQLFTKRQIYETVADSLQLLLQLFQTTETILALPYSLPM
jgi:hypothetical protein